MGQLLKVPNKRKLSKTLLIDLKKNHIKDIYDSLEILNEEFPACSLLNLDEFDTVFGNLLSDPITFFEELSEECKKREEKLACIYEAISCFVLFSQNEMEEKVQFIFQIFDFDYSGSLEMPELVLTIQAVIRGLCKFAGLKN